MLVGNYYIVESNTKDPIILAQGQPTYFILPDKTLDVENTQNK